MQSNKKVDSVDFGVTGRARIFLSAFAVLLLVATILVGASPPAMPSAQPVSASGEAFSAARASRYLEAIAAVPRPVGSAANDAARLYIMSELRQVGLEPAVQRADVLRRIAPGEFVRGSVRNVVAARFGVNSTGAVLAVAHYDSVPFSPGATDDGRAVAALMECARALSPHGARLRNDLIFLFTDGHEQGLLGADAFVAQSPLWKQVRMVLNYDARGANGPVYLFETGAQSSWAVREYGLHARYPAASSLFNEIYKVLPNATDFSVFNKTGISGLNFATAGGANFYHNPLDSTANADPQSLQQEGDQALSLLQAFGNADLGRKDNEDLTYFSALGRLWAFPSKYGVRLALVGTLIYVLLLIFGLGTGRLRFRWLAGSLGVLVVGWIATALCSYALWAILCLIQPFYRAFPFGILYSQSAYACAFVGLALLVSGGIVTLLAKRAFPAEMMASGLAPWSALAMVASLFVPGACYLFTIPLLVALPVFAALVWCVRGSRDAGVPLQFRSLQAGGVVIACVLLLPALWFSSDLIRILFLAVGMNAVVPVSFVTVLAAMLFYPLFPWRVQSVVPAVCLSLGTLALLIAGVLGNRPSTARPSQESVFYGFDMDNRAAIWATPAPGVWTSRFISTPQHKVLNEFSPSPSAFYSAAAPTLDLVAPRFEVHRTKTAGKIHFVISASPPPGAQDLMIFTPSRNLPVLSNISVDGMKPSESSASEPFRVLIVRNVSSAPVEFSFDMDVGRNVELRGTAHFAGLPQFTPSRPESVTHAATFDFFDDGTLVSRRVPMGDEGDHGNR